MSQVALYQLHRGPKSKIVIYVFKIGNEECVLKADTIIIDNKVHVVFKFKFEDTNTSNTKVKPYVTMKKSNSVLNSTVHIKVSSGGVVNQYFCSEEWIETVMNPRHHTASGNHNGISTKIYKIEIDITVNLLMPAQPLHANKELFEDTEFTDFQLHATDGSVSLHKSMLLANSDVFKAMVRSEWKEKAEGHVKIEGLTMQTLQHLKAYMYLGTLPDDGLELLLVVASQYLMDKLKADCIDKLVAKIKPENYDGLVNLACKHNLPELVSALVFRIPDDILNDIYQFKMKDPKSNDDGKK